MTNKYLEKIAAHYIVKVPRTSASDFLDTNTIVLTGNEYKEMQKDTDTNWTGKRMLGYSTAGGVYGAGVGAILGAALGALSKNPTFGAKVGASYGGILGAISGINASHNVSKAEALYKHFPELDESWGHKA